LYATRRALAYKHARSADDATPLGGRRDAAREDGDAKL
jgi:hypothetical protein